MIFKAVTIIKSLFLMTELIHIPSSFYKLSLQSPE